MNHNNFKSSGEKTEREKSLLLLNVTREMTCRVRRDGSTLSGTRILLFSSSSILSVSLMPLHPSVEPTFPMRRSPRMIPSRTVFNHCKWIYIELAITGAHSGMGPLCISSAPDTSRQSPGECFPHFIPPYQRLQPLDSRNRLSFPALHPLPSSSVLSISFCPTLSRFTSFSLSYFLSLFTLRSLSLHFASKITRLPLSLLHLSQGSLFAKSHLSSVTRFSLFPSFNFFPFLPPFSTCDLFFVPGPSRTNAQTRARSSPSFIRTRQGKTSCFTWQRRIPPRVGNSRWFFDRIVRMYSRGRGIVLSDFQPQRGSLACEFLVEAEISIGEMTEKDDEIIRVSFIFRGNVRLEQRWRSILLYFYPRCNIYVTVLNLLFVPHILSMLFFFYIS